MTAMASDFLFNGPEDAPITFVLAHGAGAPMDSAYMAYFAEQLAIKGFRVARFEFPYMAARREDGKRRPPNTAKILLETYRTVINELGAQNLIIGGKSMGGRIASIVADDMNVRGLVCLGYPFHPPGKPEKRRTEHLETIKTPTRILQGTRDPFGTADDVNGYALSSAIKVHWLEDGDHGFKPRKKSGRTEAQNWDEAVDILADFARSL
ncbi:MAG: alpha/beta family hydrolase [Rhodospirillales bacterium]